MKKHGAARIVRLILLALALALLIFVMAFPFFYMFTSSFKQDTDVFTKSMFYIPIPPNWNNYVRVWTEINFLQYYLNTIKITLVATALQFLVSAMAAYAFARMEVPLKNFFFGLFISTMMIPWTAVMIPQFILISKMHLYDTHLALILLQLFSSFGIFLLRQFFMSLPKELSEAAIIDGCGHVRIFTRIMLPLFGLLVLASVGANLSIRGMLDSDSTFLSTLGTILIMLFTVAIVAVGIMAFILMINRFYKNLLQDEGYVMMTLPVSIHQQIWSKLIVSTVWFAATVLVIILACCITAFDIRFMGELWREMKNIVHAVIQYNHMDVVANGAAFALEALILCILGSVSFCLRAYSAMAIGFSRPNHKGLFSVAAYIGTGVVLQILGGIVISLLNDSWFHRLLLGWEPQISAVAAMHLGMWVIILLMAVYSAVFYFLTVYFLQKHLNLE